MSTYSDGTSTVIQLSIRGSVGESLGVAGRGRWRGLESGAITQLHR